MAKKVEVSYNPQLGYLETVFRHDFDFLTGVRSYEVRSCGVDFEVETYHRNRAVVTIDLVGGKCGQIPDVSLREYGLLPQ